MKTSLVRIGNSRGVRIPKAVIEECGLENQVEMTVEGGKVVIAPAKSPREGWEEDLRRMVAAGDDEPLLPDTALTEWEDTEWQW
jgi:antitoxin MazE